MDATTAIYNKPLSGHEIRLVRILPNAEPDELLEVELFTVELDQAPAYEALSYVWGKHPRYVRIVCNGQKYKITSSLRGALRRLRYPTTARLVWADGLCIAQQDTEEKNHQIPLMGKIFSTAERVVVWLGDTSNDDAAAAATSMRVLCDAWNSHFDESKRLFNGIVWRPHTLPREVLVTRGAKYPVLQSFFSQPWFERIWCLQEVCLGRDVVMLWGSQDFPWEEVGDAVFWLYNDFRTIVLAGDEAEGIHRQNDYRAAFQMQQARMVRDSLLGSLETTTSFKATDPRDKVYGILSLVEPKYEAEAVPINYNWTTAEVYAQTALAHIRLSGKLTVLHYVRHLYEYNRSLQFSSWAPRWDLDLGPAPIKQEAYTWSACARLPAKCTEGFEQSPRMLKAYGLAFDEIKEVNNLPFYADAQMNDGKQHPVLEFWDGLLVTEQGNNSELTPKSRALARTLTCGIFDQGYRYRSGADLDINQKQTYYREFLDYIAYLRTKATRKPVDSDSSGLVPFGNSYGGIGFITHLISYDRRLFRTKNGAFGNGPHCMRKGDIIAVLFGGDHPFVLRRETDPRSAEVFSVLGVAYIDEIMNGELVEKMRAGEVEQREFCLT